MCYRMGYGKSYRRDYGLGCGGSLTVCLENGWNGILSACLSFSGGSDYLYGKCCGSDWCLLFFCLHRAVK